MTNHLTAEQKTAQQLQHLIDVSPAAVRELMAQFDCVVPPTVEALALLKQVKGEAFADELFILTRAASRVPGKATRYANLTGPGIEQPGTLAQRTQFGKFLDKAAATLLAAEHVIAGGSAAVTPPPTTPGDGDGEDGSDEEGNKRILGLSPVIFYGGCAVLLLVIVVLLTRKPK